MFLRFFGPLYHSVSDEGKGGDDEEERGGGNEKRKIKKEKAKKILEELPNQLSPEGARATT